MKICLTLISTILAINAFGCECPNADLDTLMKYANYAFIGEAIKNISPDSQLSDSLDSTGKGTTVEFKVLKAIKGEIADSTIIIDQRTGCANSFILGLKYLVFGYDRVRIPMSTEDRNQDYLINEMFSGASTEEIEKRVKEIEKFFNNLKLTKMYVYTDACSIFDPNSKQYYKVGKYSR